MITGFDEITRPLTDYERDVLLPVIAYGLSLKVGKATAITNGRICDALRSKGYKITEPRLRKIVNFIRTSGIVTNLIATSKGYHIATSLDEMEDYIESLKARESAIRDVRIALEGQKSAL